MQHTAQTDFSALGPVSVLTFDTFQQRTEGEAERLKSGHMQKLKWDHEKAGPRDEEEKR
jgi:hypothetical protein